VKGWHLATIAVNNVTIDFQIYGSTHQSWRQTLFGRTGGRIRYEGSRRHQRVLVRALDDVSFQLEDGDRLGLIGHNGAGKSTLLKVIAGVYAPDKGSIRVEGRISPLFTSAPGLDPDDSGYENIHTCGMFLGMSKEEINDKFSDIAEFSELGEYLELPVRTYSSGMVTRLCFAIATAIDPDILLIDEGLAAGDARFAARAEDRLHAMIQRTRIFVLATHSDGMIKATCNRAILMEKGRVVALGPVDEVINTYHARTDEPQTSQPITAAPS
jgi:ABC-type polysaccharide/polyol phosphate transport system ATPase subunit